MARVKVKTFSAIQDVLGSNIVEIEVGSPETVGELFNALLRQYGSPLKKKIWDPNTGVMTPFLITLNKTIIRSTVDMDKEIQDGDEIAIIFPIGGG